MVAVAEKTNNIENVKIVIQKLIAKALNNENKLDIEDLKTMISECGINREEVMSNVLKALASMNITVTYTNVETPAKDKASKPKTQKKAAPVVEETFEDEVDTEDEKYQTSIEKLSFEDIAKDIDEVNYAELDDIEENGISENEYKSLEDGDKHRYAEGYYSDDIVNQTLAMISSFPLLTKEEINDYISKYKATGDKYFRDKVINHNLRLVWSITRQFVNETIPQVDLFQEGTLGLQVAVERFDPSLGYAFSTYATWWIRQAISRFIYNNINQIRVPVHSMERIHRIKRFVAKYIANNGVEPTDQQISEELGYSVATIIELRRLPSCDVSLDTSVNSEDGDDSSLLGDFVAVSEEDIEQNYISNERKEIVRSYLHLLPEKMQKILILRYGINDNRERTLEEVASQFGVTRERIRQIQNKAERMLRHKRGLKEYYESK